jgi:hypothetical protein
VVGRVYAGGLDVNAEQLKRGMAWVYLQYNRDKSLLALEQEARGAKRGLWTDPNPTPPWEYRHGGRRSVSGVDASSSGGRQCSDKRYCNEIVSCKEARFYLSQCGLEKLDRDGDGVPCESLCR